MRDERQQAGQVAVVTGAGIGTGRAIALALATAGAAVVVSDIDEDVGRQTVAEFAGRARFVHADLTIADDIRRLIDSAEPTILVNNAGGGDTHPAALPRRYSRPVGVAAQPRERALQTG